ncbi:MAG: DUF3108 domain-containing protein [Bacteroidota bacterium]|nr:DUF3108 domain-containing protein [Bacteroidota bacterium]MDP4191554.1 DUF3108 domain-containing protein [Bacteroidota bacterium]
MTKLNRGFLTTLVFTLLLLVNLQAQNSKGGTNNAEFRRVENSAFKVGEKLTFDVKYGFVKAGVATMEVPRSKKISGRDVFQVTFQVMSVPSFDWFYKVRDRYETYLDIDGLFPWRFEQHIREGGYSRDFSAFFDQRKGKARTSGGEYNVPKYVNDIVSAFYLTRTFNFAKMKPGERVHLENFYDNKVFPLDVLYHGKEKVSVAAGTFNCFIVEPLVKEGGLFKSEGNILIWLSDDMLKIPVKVKTKVVVGSIDAELTAFEGLAGRLTSKR